MVQEVHVPALSLERYAPYVERSRILVAEEAARELVSRLRGRVIWNINSTAAGGGVAELLRALLGYVRGLGLDSRWMVIGGPPEFFTLTRALHDALHGAGALEASAEQRALYESVAAQNAVELETVIQPGDMVILHDPQTAGLAPHLLRLGARVIWRCHIGHDVYSDSVRAAWAFLEPYLAGVETMIFTRRSYVPPQFADREFVIIPPSIDPTTPKNQDLPDEHVRAILVHTGVVEGPADPSKRCFKRTDGTPGRVDRYADVIRLGPAIQWETRTVVQISRWDHLKDPIGVMRGFARMLEQCGPDDVALVLAGPNVHGVADDPAAAEAFDDVLSAWRALPHPWRRHVHLVTMPMADVEENAAIVNALQRHATIVVQKSLHEGFGLTVAEAMWKARPVIASAVGGIRDQIDDGVDGLLIDKADDLDAFAEAVERLLSDEALATKLGRAAKEKVRQRFLGLETLIRFGNIVARGAQGAREAEVSTLPH